MNSTRGRSAAAPVANAVLIQTGRGYLWRVLHCPLCGGQHVHGAGGLDDDPTAYLGHRAAHCGDGGYVLVACTCGRKP